MKHIDFTIEKSTMRELTDTEMVNVAGGTVEPTEPTGVTGWTGPSGPGGYTGPSGPNTTTYKRPYEETR